MQGKILLAALLLCAGPALAGTRPVPVRIGQVEDLDACLSLGVVTGLRHSLLAVRAGPGPSFQQVDELGNGREVFLCDASADSEWHGIVYPASEGDECGVTSPVPTERPYPGPCRSGWVHRRWIKVIAG